MKSMKTFKSLFLIMLMAFVLLLVVGCGGSKIELSFDDESYEVEVGKEIPLAPTVKNEKDEEYKLVFSSTDDAVVTYVDGKIKGIAVGEAKVKVILDGNEKIFAEVTVKVNAAKKFKVTFITDGGSAVESIDVTDGNKVAKPGDPTKAGYVFVGWYSDAAKTTAYDFNKPVTGVLILYGKWNLASYEVTFDVDGGSAVASVGVLNGSKVSEPADPTKENHQFIGWYADEALTVEYDFEDAITGNTTIYAKWELNSYDITLNTNGGNTLAKISVKHGAKAIKPANPTKFDHKFMGWFKEEALTNEFLFDTDVVTGPITLYAKWEFDMTGKVSTEFVLNGGSFSIFEHDLLIRPKALKTQALTVYNDPSIYMANAGKAVMMFDPDLDLSNMGWAYRIGLKLNENGFYEVAGKHPGSSTAVDLTDYEKILVAHDSYGIGYSFVMGLIVGQVVTITGIDSTTVQPGLVDGMINIYPEDTGNLTTPIIIGNDAVLPKAEKDEFVFGGWYAAEDFSGDAATKPIEGKLYAKWNLPTYAVNYDLNHGTWGWTVNEVTTPGDGIDEYSNLPEIFMQDFYTYLKDNNLLTSTVVDAGLHKTTWADFSKSYTDPRAIYNWAANKPDGGLASDLTGYSQLFLESGTGDVATGDITTLLGGFFGADGYKQKYATLVQHLSYLLLDKYPGNTLWAGGTSESLAGFAFDGYFYGTQGLLADTKPNYERFNALRGVIPIPDKGYKFVEGALVEYVYDFLNDSLTKGDELVLSIPTREDYLFAGWYDNADFTGDRIFKIAAGEKPAAMYYAKWESLLPEVDVTFNSNGGSAVKVVKAQVGKIVIMPMDPTKAGFVFGGWYTDEALTTEFALDTAMNAAITLYAKWNVRVDLALDGGTLEGLFEEAVIADGAKVTLQDLQFFNINYGGTYAETSIWIYEGDNELFAGTSETEDLSYWAYKIGLTKIAPNVFLVAENVGYSKDTPQGAFDYYLLGLWKTNTYAGFAFVQNSVAGEVLVVTGVDFNAVEGSAVDAEIAKYEGKDVTVNQYVISGIDATLSTPTKEGFTFGGWFAAADFSGTAVTTVSEGIKLYAKWTAVE